MAKKKTMATSRKASKKKTSFIKSAPFSTRTLLLLILFLVVAGFAYVFLTRAAVTCGTTVANYSYQVPFGKAIWNQPICGLPRHSQSADYANRLYKWGNVNDGTDTSLFGKISTNPDYPDPNALNPYGNLFSREVYYASKSTTETRIATVSYYSNLDGAGVKTFTPDAKIPWNPKWETGQGGDNEMVILDDRPGPTQGRVYTLSGYWTSNPRFPQRKIPPVGCYAAWEQNRICTYDTQVGRDLQGNYIDYRTYEGFVKDRGVGIPYLATLTLPEELEAGEIRHALGISIPNTAYGPICQKSQLGNYSQEGKTCGTAVAPATKFEWASSTTPPVMKEAFRKLYTLEKTIPEGMRFGLDISYDQIDKWIQSRPDLVSNPRRAKTARIIAVAMKDYGLLVADTNGARVGLQMAGGANPDNAKKWTDLGLGPEQKDNLLDGLVTASNLYVVDPPVATCIDGTKSKYYCDWKSIQYPTATITTTSTSSITPKPTATPTPTPTPTPKPTNTPTPTPAKPTVTDSTKPSVPTGLTLDLVLADAAAVSWKPSTDNLAVAGYNIRIDGRSIGKTADTKFYPMSLTPNRSYRLTVSAYDAVGNESAQSSPLTITTKNFCFLWWCL